MKKDENGVYWEDGKIEYTNDTRVLTRDEMREEYPMRWVGLTNVEKKENCVVKGTVAAFGDKSKLLLLQFEGKLDHVTFTNLEILNGGVLLNVF